MGAAPQSVNQTEPQPPKMAPLQKKRNMKTEKRKELMAAIKAAVSEMTADESDAQSIVQVAGHTISRRLVYAGCSQWSGCGRDWDETQSGWAWVIDGAYLLTRPSLGGFNGHNMIEQQSQYYLQPNFAEWPPTGPEGDPMDKPSTRLLLEIASAIHCAREAVIRRQAIEDSEADRLLGLLAPTALAA